MQSLDTLLVCIPHKAVAKGCACYTKPHRNAVHSTQSLNGMLCVLHTAFTVFCILCKALTHYCCVYHTNLSHNAVYIYMTQSIWRVVCDTQCLHKIVRIFDEAFKEWYVKTALLRTLFDEAFRKLVIFHSVIFICIALNCLYSFGLQGIRCGKSNNFCFTKITIFLRLCVSSCATQHRKWHTGTHQNTSIHSWNKQNSTCIWGPLLTNELIILPPPSHHPHTPISDKSCLTNSEITNFLVHHLDVSIIASMINWTLKIKSLTTLYPLDQITIIIIIIIIIIIMVTPSIQGFRGLSDPPSSTTRIPKPNTHTRSRQSGGRNIERLAAVIVSILQKHNSRFTVV